ncbi:MAG TPA: 3-dehydroquinate synthase [Candidatus Eisenbacteria bacterium]|jgi:3-dehydroquinate synthase|nr:3-dehydroquinate synthase [Candidatus Eisenbacteria bacterium]
MRSIRVSLGERSYPIHIGQGLLREAGRLIRQAAGRDRHVVVVSQHEVASRHAPALCDSLTREGLSHSTFLVPPSKSSEAAKSQAVYSKLIRELAARGGKSRSVLLAALGGGVIGDLTGFAASVYRRGVPYVQIPTTLTAQVDSAIGGKTGIDLPEGKNLLGTIYQPAAVLSDTEVLQTLPERHWSDGFAEVIKYGIIKDAGLFLLLERQGIEGARRPRTLETVIALCARIKAKVVEKDELDKKDVRIVLNFGHTAGHAIEAASRFSRQYTHGEAVAIGMLVACDLAAALGVLKDRGLTGRLEKTLIKFKLPLYYKGMTLDALWKAIGYDKKAEAGMNRFILPVSLGKVVVVNDVPAGAITEALQKRKG